MSRTSPAAAVAVLCCFVMMCGAPFLPRCEGCRHDERSALLEILDQFTYNESSVDLSSRDCCEWDAVTCSSRTGRVTGLDLSILESIGSGSGLLNATTFLPLQELRNLSLSYLYIQGCYPGAGLEDFHDKELKNEVLLVTQEFARVLQRERPGFNAQLVDWPQDHTYVTAPRLDSGLKVLQEMAHLDDTPGHEMPRTEDSIQLRKNLMVQMLTIKDNEAAGNIPDEIRAALRVLNH